MVKKRPQGDPLDVGSWKARAPGQDADSPERLPGAIHDPKQTTRIAEAFERNCDTVTMSISRWSSKAKMNANINFMLKTHDENIINTSFMFFRSDVDSLQIPDSCWDVYFRRRGAYLRTAQRAMEGRRPGQPVRKAGDIVVDNERFHTRESIERTDTDF